MWKKLKMLTACVCAAAWWSVLYPELCFTQETCRLVQTADEENEGKEFGTAQTGDAGQAEPDALAQGGETDMAAGILRAGDGEVVISSRFLEWCEENLFD